MSRYSIGIDLGTTNSAVSYFNLDEAKARGTAQTMLAIPQVTAVGTVEEKLLLPSFLYLPNDQEFPAGSLALPWDKKRKDAVGSVEEKLLLPSFLYLPNDQEFPAGSLALPWDKKRKDAVGTVEEKLLLPSF